MLDENRLRHHGTNAAGTKEQGNSYNDMDEKDNEVVHLLIVTKPGITLGLCQELTIRQGQVAKPVGPAIDERIGLLKLVAIRIHQSIDELVPLLGILVIEKLSDPFDFWNPSCEIQVNTSQKLQVGRKTRMRNLVFVHFFEDKVINEVFPGDRYQRRFWELRTDLSSQGTLLFAL